MSTFFLAAFFALFAIMHLVETKIPNWVLGALAAAVCLALLVGANWKRTP